MYFIYNSQEIVNRIKLQAKKKRMTVKEMLILCNLGVNTISKMANNTDILTKNFAKIADCLDCSVDYLLGRSEIIEVAKVPDEAIKQITEEFKENPSKIIRQLDKDALEKILNIILSQK